MRRLSILSIFFATTLLACGGGPSTDSETHWQENQGDPQNTQTGPENQNQWTGDNQGDDNSSYGPIAPLHVDIEESGRFGQIPAGETKNLSFTISPSAHIAADGYFEFTNITIDSDAFTVDPPFEDWPHKLRHDEPIQGQFTFTPTHNRAQAATISIRGEPMGATDGTLHNQLIILSANLPCLTVDAADQLIFSALDSGDRETKTVSITNCATVAEFDITPEIRRPNNIDPHPFMLLPPQNSPQLMEPGQTLEVSIEYTAIDPERDRGHLVFYDERRIAVTSVLLQSEAYPARQPDEVANQNDTGSGDEFNASWNDRDDGD